jgi:hypothetical protein
MVEIGGSDDCLKIVKDGHDEIKNLLSDKDGRIKLVDTFNVCDIEGTDDPLGSRRNAQLFAGDGVVYIPAQENDPSCTTDLCNVEKICKKLIDDTSNNAIDKLSNLAKSQNGGECTTVDWERQIQMLKSLAATAGGTRSWLYQTCNEFGFYQTCDIESDCPYALGLHPVDQDLEMCERVFNKTDVEDNVAKSNDFYGGWNIQSKRIMFVNGNVDPWSTLAVTSTNPDIDIVSECLPAFWVDGASHHFWTHEILDTDTTKVNDARDKIWAQVTDWLAIEEKECC